MVVCNEFGDEGFEEVRGGGAGGGELRFQLVYQGHQLIHFGPFVVALGAGRIGVLVIPDVGWWARPW